MTWTIAYFIVVALCIAGFSIGTWLDVRKGGFVTVGELFGFTTAAVVPFVNVLVLIFLIVYLGEKLCQVVVFGKKEEQ